MIICLCHRVSDRDIVRAVREGTRIFDVLQEDLLVAVSCACCHDSAKGDFRRGLLGVRRGAGRRMRRAQFDAADARLSPALHCRAGPDPECVILIGWPEFRTSLYIRC
jgi:bacterioferritin-associated ferredoxin